MVAFKRCFVAQTAGFRQGRGELAGSVMNRMPSKGYGMEFVFWWRFGVDVEKMKALGGDNIL